MLLSNRPKLEYIRGRHDPNRQLRSGVLFHTHTLGLPDGEDTGWRVRQCTAAMVGSCRARPGCCDFIPLIQL